MRKTFFILVLAIPLAASLIIGPLIPVLGAANGHTESMGEGECAQCAAGHAPAGRAWSLGALESVSFGLFDTSGFPPRWECGTAWTSTLGWVHIGSDIAIWGAYMAIPLALFLFIRKRSDVPFMGIFWLFIAFIAACGTGHLVEAGIFWWPVYRFDGLVKLITAVVSWATVIALLPIIPKALELPGLQSLNERLQNEVTVRADAEDKAVARARELEEAQSVFIGREQRVIELKREINELAGLLGRQAPYELRFADDPEASK